MKRLLITLLTFIIGFCAFSQEKQTLDEIKRQAVEIERLKDEIKGKDETISIAQNIIAELTKYRKYKEERKEYDDTVASLHQRIQILMDSTKRLNAIIQDTTITERHRGKEEALSSIINTYKSKNLDDILKEKTMAIVVQDSEILGTNSSVSDAVTSAKLYFEAQGCLSAPYSEDSVSKALDKLNSVSVDSEYVSNLKTLLENYSYYYEDFKKMIEDLVKIDNENSVEGMDKKNVDLKTNDILSVISKYIFSYDFNLNDYPYITEQLLEVLKTKIKTPDASLQAIANKLK